MCVCEHVHVCVCVCVCVCVSTRQGLTSSAMLTPGFGGDTKMLFWMLIGSFLACVHIHITSHASASALQLWALPSMPVCTFISHPPASASALQLWALPSMPVCTFISHHTHPCRHRSYVRMITLCAHSFHIHTHLCRHRSYARMVTLCAHSLS